MKAGEQPAKTACENMSLKTIWLTGLSGAGKSTVALALKRVLEGGDINVFILDGDVVRTGLCSDLGFTAEDRTENIRRVSEVAKILNAAGITVIVALISPFIKERQRARGLIGETFVEVFVDCPLEVCEGRDPKGLYKRARSGELQRFTGVSDPYEAPQSAEVHLHTHTSSVDECVAEILKVVWDPASRLLKTKVSA